MSTYVFLGPTLPLEDARGFLDAAYLPPVRQGDIYRLVELRRPRSIAVIDGYFSQVPAVWHKEILWALSNGVQVLGAASMGALRAAELAPFGMRGVGRIAEAYRTGVLSPYDDEIFEDDDEVAVQHAPAEMGYRCLSDAMVNIRASLAAAVEAKAIDNRCRDGFVRLAKRLFYPQRNYEQLLADARRSDLPRSQIEALEDWLPSGRVDQKREDALSLLRLLRHEEASQADTRAPDFQFHETAFWRSATEVATRYTSPKNDVLEELRLDPPVFLTARRSCIEQLIGTASEEATADSSADGADAPAPTTAVLPDAALNDWHGSPERVAAHWNRALHSRDLERFASALPTSLVERQMLQHLRRVGGLESLEARCRHKGATLRDWRPPVAAARLDGLRELQLHDWYFSRRLNRSIPENLSAYLEELGYSGVADFNEALMREYAYLERAGGEER